MSTENIIVLGDSGTEYAITIFLDQANPPRMRLECGCPAGQRHTLCKHVRRLLCGDYAKVKHPQDRERLEAFLVPQDTALELERLEKEQARIKRQIARLKETLTACLDEGIPIK